MIGRMIPQRPYCLPVLLCFFALLASPAFAAENTDPRSPEASPEASGTATTGSTEQPPSTQPEPAASPADMPFDTPFSAPFGTLPATDSPYDPNLKPDFDAPMAPVAETPPASAGPDYQPPAIDAYVDLAFTDGDLSHYGFDDTPGGYRFIVGFRLEKSPFANLTIAPEIGYLRIGKAEDQTVTRTNNMPIPQYVNVRTTTDHFDVSTLQFGLRAAYHLAGPLDAYVRTGVHFYHLAESSQVVLSYEPIPPNTTPRPDDVQTSSSRAKVGTGAFGAVGYALSLGQVPSLQLEYGLYEFDGKPIGVFSFGALLNF